MFGHTGVRHLSRGVGVRLLVPHRGHPTPSHPPGLPTSVPSGHGKNPPWSAPPQPPRPDRHSVVVRWAGNRSLETTEERPQSLESPPPRPLTYPASVSLHGHTYPPPLSSPKNSAEDTSRRPGDLLLWSRDGDGGGSGGCGSHSTRTGSVAGVGTGR